MSFSENCRMIKFIHAADLHLGLRITRFEEHACERLVEARFAAIEQIRAKAIEQRVDFILIAGDVFDDHSVDKTTAVRAFEILEGKSLDCPVYIIPGNHDPLIPGGVWDRDPWTREQPTKHIQLLRECSPVAVRGKPVTLFPCPLRNRNSIDDPTAWIAKHPRTADDRTIRIGMAHGSLNILPNLPLDDHLIRRDAADYYGLDYLALGHWHKPLTYPSSDRIVRTAYSGTHEPMRFPGLAAGVSTGWKAYSPDSDADYLQDAGLGQVNLVTIEAPGASPIVEAIEVGYLRWAAKNVDLTARPIGGLISELTKRDQPGQTLLWLTLAGVVEPREHARIDELATIVRGRFVPGSRVEADKVLIEPQPEQLRSAVGEGVLKRVLEKLQEEAKSTDPDSRTVAEHALKLLYQLACEDQPA